MAARVVRCDRCQRRARSFTGWNVTMSRGQIVGHLCPDCQTPAENAEAEINEATTIYARTADGQIVGRPKRA